MLLHTILAEATPHPLWQKFISSHIVWGLALGLLIAFFIWKSAVTAKATLRREIRRLKDEARDLHSHLNTQLKINASGNETLQKQIEDLKEQNETLRVNYAASQQKPGKQEIRQLHIMESAVRVMRKQAPGFAPVWEQALAQAEEEQNAAEGGLRKLVKKVIPSIGHAPSPPPAQDARITMEAETTGDKTAS